MGRLLLLVVLIAGCGRSSPQKAEPENRGDSSKSTGPSTAKPDAPAVTPTVSETEEGSPAAAFRRFVEGIAESHPEAFFDALPESYQLELDLAVREAANSINGDLWQELHATLNQAVDVLRTERNRLIATPWAADQAWLQAEHFTRNGDELIAMAQRVLDSDELRWPQLREATARSLLAGPVARVLRRLSSLSKKVDGDPWAEWIAGQRSIRMVVLKQEGEKAWVRMESDAADWVPREEVWVRIEGRWIPEAWTQDWTAKMDRLVRLLAPPALRKSAPPADKDRLRTILKESDAALAALRMAPDQAAFNKSFEVGIQQPLTVWLSGVIERKTAPTKPPEELGGSVLVVVRESLDAAARDDWQKRLGDVADSPDLAICIPAIQGDTVRFEVNPVKDLESFAKRITFAKVVSVDKTTNTVTLELMAPP